MLARNADRALCFFQGTCFRSHSPLSENASGLRIPQQIGNADCEIMIQAVLASDEAGIAVASLGQIRSAASALILQVRYS